MKDWKECTIGDVCSSISETYSRKDQEVVLVNTSDVLEGKILNHIAEPNINLKGQFKKTFQKDDILFSEIRPANRRYAYVDLEDTRNYIASTKLMVIRANQEIINPKFLFALLTSNELITEMQHLAETRSGTFPQITFSSELSSFPISLPPLPTQQKIAAVLSALDDKIELNRQINANLEQQAQAIFKNWFVDFEPFGGQMPRGWRMGILSDVARLSAGGDKPKETSDKKTENYNIPIYSNGLDNYGLYGFTNKATIFEESVTVSARGTIGFVCLRNEPYFPIVRLVSVIPSCSNVSAKYLYLSLKNKSISGTGTTQQQLTVPAFSKEDILIPTENAMLLFTNLVQPMFSKIFELRKESNTLASIRDTLLPKLMNGEIDVSSVKV